MLYCISGDNKSFEPNPLTYQLRDVCVDDHEFLVELHNDPIVLRNATHPQSITMEHHLLWWAKVSKDPAQLRRIFLVDDERVGFAKFYNVDHENSNCVLGADIHEKFRGRGYAKHMWSLMLSHCFNTWKLHRVSLTTATYNPIAQHIYKSLGFVEEGRLIQSLHRDGQFHDQILMYLLRDNWKC